MGKEYKRIIVDFLRSPTGSTTPVGNFHTPDPRNLPLFSWTARTLSKLQYPYQVEVIARTTSHDARSLQFSKIYSNKDNNSKILCH